MAKAKAARAPEVSPEESARQTLAWGAGALILGLAVVGVGFDDLGVLPALAGLLLLVYGIHTYGRLGPDDQADPASSDLTATQGRVWTSGLVAVAGLAVALGSAGGSGVKVVLAYGAVLGGGFRVIRGLSALSRLSKAPAVLEKRVEKRRRMNKSAPP